MLEATDAVLATERPQLMAMAFRMLGTVADAEDAVQEAYIRWLRLDETDRAVIARPGAWLTRTLGRVCLDILSSARARRERYVGEWLPEPVPALALVAPPPDPAAAAERRDEVSTALLIVLEELTPAERVAFVLHDVFAVSFGEIAEVLARSAAAARQLASSARRRVREREDAGPSLVAHDALVAAFAEASATGDYRALVGILAPDVVLRSDGGGVVSAARRPVAGADRVARFLLGLAAKHPDTTFEPVRTGDGIAFVARRDGRLHSVWKFAVRGGSLSEIWIVATPAKLTLWQ
jgi:RNA polymerase sigma-70 factor, ECF subfamily